MSTAAPSIRRLPQKTINRIAAGEVVERAASAIKELAENALDAGARQIDIRTEGGGQVMLSVTDDGKGMSREELVLAIERHATSKLPANAAGEIDLLNIHTMGFRGEALPSIGSVARLHITTQTLDSGEAWTLSVEGGTLNPPRPAPRFGLSGTRVEVRDLFYATPARLKFLQTERSENLAVTDIVKRMAMSRADVGFSLHNGVRSQLNLTPEADNAEGRLKRLADILGHDFSNNALLIDAEREGIKLSGYAGLPTFSRGSSTHQYLFVNGRPVRDKLLHGAVRGAYQDFLARGRHPVVEALNPGDSGFVPNDCVLQDAQRLWLITGPNMAGKSTFLRQNALIALMAQAGSFVPAEAAHIGVVDRLFSRVGAADDLARGRSTFMVEMVETATILNQATERSLVILDEIGRGTATFDGLSIAWATLEHLHDINRSRALFATHYHEMTALSNKLGGVDNATVAVKEWDGEVIFLHEVRKGAADRSYGVQVAQLAGLPPSVIARARVVLEALEKGEREGGATQKTLIDDLPLFAVAPAPAPQPKQSSKLEETLAEIIPDELSPREALDLLYKLKEAAKT